MPTGYTAAVGDGEVTDFAVFAKRCARAMGALISMREDPADAPIPEAFKPNTKHADESIERAQRELADAVARTEEEWRAMAAQRDQEMLQAREQYEAKRKVTKARYEAMLEKVEAWTPPTDEHVGLKEFMAEQLRESIRFDCGTSFYTGPPELYGDDWRKLREFIIAQASKDLSYYEKSRQEEIDRAAARTKWVQDLLASLEKVDV